MIISASAMLPVAYVVFFGSGMAALLYQVVWQRLLVMFAGSDVHSATIVVAAFMAGLGLGSMAGGRIADRLSPRQRLLAFVGAELAIGAFGLVSAWLYYDVLYQKVGTYGLGLEARGALLFLSLLWPTFFMGLSLPLLARALTPTIERAASITSGLYGANTLGAAVGAFATTWYLLPQFGLPGALRLGTILNVLAAVAVAPMIRRADARAATRSPDARPSSSVPRIPLGPWAAAYALSGFVALSLEITWFRLIGVLQKSTSLTFGTLLAIYLGGLGLGAALGAVLVRRSRQPARAFFLTLAAAGIMAGLAFGVLLWLVASPQTIPWLSAHLSGYEPISIGEVRDALQGATGGNAHVTRDFFWLYFGIPALLIGPSTLLMGAAFPLLQRAVQNDLSQLGSRVGTLLTANIAGSAAGALATGWFLFDQIGTAGTLKVLIVMTAALPLLFRKIARSGGGAWSPQSGIVSLAAGLALAAAIPGNFEVWGRLHGSSAGLIVGEDGSGTSVLKRITEPGRDGAIVYVNGLGQSWIPYGGVHTMLGALPAFVHPDPRDATIIGLGSGDTVFGLAGRPTVQRIAAIEIVRPQLATLRDLSASWPYPGLATLLSDRRIEHVYGDGRLYLAQTERRFDIIEADALRPTSAYAGHLYSDGYFKLLRSRLKPNGIAVSWAPTVRVRDTFATVFPHVIRFGDIMMGSNEPISLDHAAIIERLRDERVQTYFRRAGIDATRLLMTVLNTEPTILGPSDDRRGLTDINTDLMPKDEFGKR